MTLSFHLPSKTAHVPNVRVHGVGHYEAPVKGDEALHWHWAICMP